MKQLNWGIIGPGVIAHQFCQDMQYVTNGKLLAVAARHLDRAQQFAEKYNIEKAYQGYQALFDDVEIDVVYIATPHTLHFQQVHDALMAGKSVLCEKPFTVSSSECRQLSLLAKEKGLFLMEAMWTYFLPAIRQAKHWLDSGRIGKIKHIKADFGYPIPYDPESRVWNEALAGGCLLDMGIYPIALAQFFLGQPMASLTVNAQMAPNGVDKDVIILAEVGEARVSLATSFQCKLQNWAYIIGEQGYIAIPNFWRADQCTLYKLDEEIDHFSDDRQSLGFNYEAEAVGEAILNGQIEHPLMPLKLSYALQQQMEQIKDKF